MKRVKTKAFGRDVVRVAPVTFCANDSLKNRWYALCDEIHDAQDCDPASVVDTVSRLMHVQIDDDVTVSERAEEDTTIIEMRRGHNAVRLWAFDDQSVPFHISELTYMPEGTALVSKDVERHDLDQAIADLARAANKLGVRRMSCLGGFE